MKTIFVIYVALAAATTVVAADHTIDESENPQFLFVISAESGSYDGETLTLSGVPSAVYFSDGPYRIAGHISLEKFTELWREGTDSFKTDPPNATISILGEDANTSIVVELSNPLLIENGVTFEIKILDGKIPISFGFSGLFIDPFPTALNLQITD